MYVTVFISKYQVRIGEDDLFPPDSYCAHQHQKIIQQVLENILILTNQKTDVTKTLSVQNETSLIYLKQFSKVTYQLMPLSFRC